MKPKLNRFKMLLSSFCYKFKRGEITMSNPNYGPDISGYAPRFTGIRTFMKFPVVQDMNNVDVAVVGIPFDTGASFRAGARFGPSAIRDISAFLRPANGFHGINPFQHLSVVDYGDIPVLPGYMEDSFERITSVIKEIGQQGVVPIGIGGDHSITLAELRALSKIHGPLSLVQFDAHGDTWDDYWGKKYTHGTPFRRAMEEGILDPETSIQIGLRGTLYDPKDFDEARQFGFDIVTANELRKLTPIQLAERVRAKVGNRPVFLTFDIDFYDPSCAPGTGTPEIAGFSSAEGLAYLQHLTGIRFVGFDLVEVLPAFDVSQITSLLGANMIYEFISLLAVGRRDGIIPKEG
jgi:agmatinase